MSITIFVSFTILVLSCSSPQPKEAIVATDPLPSWNETSTKQQIIDFVTKTTKTGSPDFIPEADRIAVFDNDGTLWSEQPMYFQMAYGIDYIKKEAPNHPDWKSKEPFKSIVSGDLEAVMKGGEKA